MNPCGEGANYTRTRLPVRLVFAEEIARIDDAFAREKQLQGWSRAKKAALIDGRWSELQVLARRRGEAGGPFENLRDRTQPGR